MSGRTPRLLVDSMPWLYYILGHEALHASWKEQMDQSAKHGKLFLCAASVAEIAQLIHSEKLTLQQQGEKWLQEALTLTKTQILAIDEQIGFEAEQLPKAPVSLTSYEKLMLATARIHNMAILTERQVFLDYAKTGFVKVKS